MKLHLRMIQTCLVLIFRIQEVHRRSCVVEVLVVEHFSFKISYSSKFSTLKLRHHCLSIGYGKNTTWSELCNDFNTSSNTTTVLLFKSFHIQNWSFKIVIIFIAWSSITTGSVKLLPTDRLMNIWRGRSVKFWHSCCGGWSADDDYNKFWMKKS